MSKTLQSTCMKKGILQSKRGMQDSYPLQSSKRIYSYIMIVVGGLLSLSIESILPKEEFYLQNLLSLK
jgi:hypothetical protein